MKLANMMRRKELVLEIQLIHMVLMELVARYGVVLRVM